MDLLSIYKFGKFIPMISLPEVDEKLAFILFKYRSKDILGVAVLALIICFFLALVLSPFSPFFKYTFVYLGIIISIFLYIYPTKIYYAQQMIDYSEEMLRAIMKLSTFISIHTSMEYSFKETALDLRGTLRLQFDDILTKIKHKEYSSLGEALSLYIPQWNKTNPDFVKSLKLLQTAEISPESEKKQIITEVIETIILSYHQSGKRFAESLASKSKSLVAMGVLLPIISLMILPLASIFLPGIVSAPLIAFIYNIVFPSVLLVMALNFSVERIQVDTIHLEDSPKYEPVPFLTYVMSAIIAAILAIPTYFHAASINLSTAELASREYTVSSILMMGAAPFGIVIAIWLFTKAYLKQYEKMWDDVSEVEQDFPYLLQIFSTYLNLNQSVESIIPEIINDYETHGFKDHSVVRIFKELDLRLRTSKKTIEVLFTEHLPKICPSHKVSQSLKHIVSFTNISQKSAASASKMVREQTLSIYKLDDYIRSLLSETVGLISITVTFLAPLLSAVAVIMSLAIVMSLSFISDQLETISSSMGAQVKGLELVDIQTIIPPTIIELIVSIYLIEMILVLSLYLTNIKIGNDRYQFIKTLNSNIIFGFMLYATILISGFVIFRSYIFKGVIG
jgi:hypothetical protein